MDFKSGQNRTSSWKKVDFKEFFESLVFMAPQRERGISGLLPSGELEILLPRKSINWYFTTDLKPIKKEETKKLIFLTDDLQNGSEITILARDLNLGCLGRTDKAFFYLISRKLWACTIWRRCCSQAYSKIESDAFVKRCHNHFKILLNQKLDGEIYFFDFWQFWLASLLPFIERWAFVVCFLERDLSMVKVQNPRMPVIIPN